MYEQTFNKCGETSQATDLSASGRKNLSGVFKSDVVGRNKSFQAPITGTRSTGTGPSSPLLIDKHRACQRHDVAGSHRAEQVGSGATEVERRAGLRSSRDPPRTRHDAMLWRSKREARCRTRLRPINLPFHPPRPGRRVKPFRGAAQLVRTSSLQLRMKTFTLLSLKGFRNLGKGSDGGSNDQRCGA